MVDILYAEINVIGIVLLLLFLTNMNKGCRKNMRIDQLIFNACMVMNILIFLFDTGMWVFDGHSMTGLRTANQIVTMLYYVSNPLICFMWLLYTDYRINESRNGLLKRIRFYAIPCAVSTILSIVSLHTGWLFRIDASNNYTRGPLFSIMAVIALSYLLFSFGLSLKDIVMNGWEGPKTKNTYLLVVPIWLVAASAVQIMFYGVSIIWVCSMLAFAAIYISIQNSEISSDHLTGLYNRRRLDEHFHRRVTMRNKAYHLFAIMLDLDDFKKVNDNYGHEAGDNVLIKMAELLREVCNDSDDFVARMGGDEFVVLGERAEIEQITQLVDEISSATGTYNEHSQLDYLLQPSMGYSVYKTDDTANSFFASADQAMFQNKQERKRARSQ